MAQTVTNATAFRQVFNQHWDAVLRYCLRRLPVDDANDAAAQVFVVAWRKFSDMPSGESVLPWLYRVAHYEVSTARRSRRRVTSLRTKLAGQANAEAPSADIVVVRKAEYQEILDALATLSEADREVILLRSQEELSLSEMAAVLGCSQEAAKKRLARALARLRKAAGVSGAAAATQPRATEEGGAA